MRSWLNKFSKLVSVYYSMWLEYRAELLLWAASGVLPLIMMGVWVQASRSGQFPLSAVEFARYFVAVFIVRQLSSVWVIWEFEEDMLQGRLSPYLLQPIDPGWRYLSQQLGERLARLPLLLGLVVVFYLLYPFARWIPRWHDIPLALLATAGAFVLRFIMQYTTSLLSFWTEKASSVEEFWTLMYLFLSGYIAPLDVYPAALREVILWTPFPYMIDFPARLLVGQPAPLARSFAILAAWCIVFFALNRWLWKRGLKRYSAMGA